MEKKKECFFDVIGDEGKGKLIGSLGKKYDYVFRVNACTNAGHCVCNEKGNFVTRQLPSVFYPKKTKTTLVVSPGALLNLDMILDELTSRPDTEELKGMLKISSTITLVLPPYRLAKRAFNKKKIGSTNQGTGVGVVSRVAKHNIKLIDVKNVVEKLDTFENVYEKLLTNSKQLGFLDKITTGEELKELLKKYTTEIYPKLAKILGNDFCIDYTSFLSGILSKKNTSILIEGCNGILLDNIFGILPYVTSNSTIPSGLISGCNLSPLLLRKVIIVIAAYSCCLNKRPFPTEMSDEESKHFFTNCNEVDVAEAMKRRLGWIDLPALRKSLVGCGGSVLHINKVDVLSGLKKIKICVKYKIGEKEYEIMPDNPILQAKATPVYVEVDGWEEKITQVKKFDELPRNAKEYVNLVQKILGYEIVSIGVGPKNDQIIRLSK